MQGSVLKKDFMTFYVNFPPEVIAATQEAAAVAEEGITVEPDVDLAEKVIIVAFIRDATFYADKCSLRRLSYELYECTNQF